MNDAVVFAPREVALEPTCVVAFGGVARALARRLLSTDDDARLARLRGVASDDAIALLGDADALPFVDGVVYLGVEADVASLLLPTTQAPSVRARLLASALEERGVALPTALVPRDDALHVLPLGDARPVTRARLEAFCERGATR